MSPDGDKNVRDSIFKDVSVIISDYTQINSIPDLIIKL